MAQKRSPITQSSTRCRLATSTTSSWRELVARIRPLIADARERVPRVPDMGQIIISEVGLDMSKRKTEKQYCSFLGLCPDNSISGGKVLHRATRKVYNRAADTLRLCAQSLTHSKSALGAKYRRLRARLGAPKAIVAMAHHLARLVYRMLRYGQNYVEQG